MAKVHPPQETDLEIFFAMPLALQIELRVAMYKSCLKERALVLKASVLNAPFLVPALCHTAISSKQNFHGTVVYTRKDEAAAMMFPSMGTFVYSSKNEGEEVEISVGQWACEVVLWRSWHHKGTLVSTSASELALLDSKQFQAVVHDQGQNVIAQLRKYVATAVDILSLEASDVVSADKQNELNDLIFSEFGVGRHGDML